MVFFTCNACGESLKKAQVDKHVGMCRGCQVLSCIDCGKDFWGDDYKNHLRCISEDQKYGGKGFEAKANKGEVKQQQWIQRIQEAMNKPGISPKIKDILSQVSSYDNVPRKKAKFQNWMKNSLRIHTPTLHDQVWEIFSAATSNAPGAEKPQPPAVAVKADTNGSEETQQNGSTEETDPDKKKKLNKRERKEARSGKSGKRKQSVEDNVSDEQALEGGVGKKSKKEKKRKKACEENEDGQQNGEEAGEEMASKKRKKSKDTDEAENQTTEAAEEQMDTTVDETVSKGKFNWKGTIKAVLRQAPEEGLSVKKLRKKVLAAYYSFSGEANFRSEEDLIALFNKKISKNPKFRLLKDKVRLVQ